MAHFRLYLITDPAIGDVPAAVERALGALPAGSAAVQLRDRAAFARELFGLAGRLAAIGRLHGAPLFVNDRADVALAAGADGVHLRGDSIALGEARALGLSAVGASTHRIEEVERAARGGADFVVFGPVFASPGKSRALGLGALRRAAHVGIPVYALGGVDETNAGACIRAGAAGVACIRAVLGAPDPEVRAGRLLRALDA